MAYRGRRLRLPSRRKGTLSESVLDSMRMTSSTYHIITGSGLRLGGSRQLFPGFVPIQDSLCPVPLQGVCYVTASVLRPKGPLGLSTQLDSSVVVLSAGAASRADVGESTRGRHLVEVAMPAKLLASKLEICGQSDQGWRRVGRYSTSVFDHAERHGMANSSRTTLHVFIFWTQIRCGLV